MEQRLRILHLPAVNQHIRQKVTTQSLYHAQNLVTPNNKKVIPQQAEVAQRVPGRLRPRIFVTFGTTRVVGRQLYTPAAFTPGEIPGTHF